MNDQCFEIYICASCGVEISKRLYEKPFFELEENKEGKNGRGHGHFKVTVNRETGSQSWHPYYPYQLLRRNAILRADDESPGLCSRIDHNISITEAMRSNMIGYGDQKMVK